VGTGKFDPARLHRLNDPERFEMLPPAVLWRALGAEGADVIVDIGAGTGLFASAMCALAPHALVYAADSESAMVEWMRTNRPEVAEGCLVPLLAQESRVPLDDAIADAVYMVNLHHELLDPTATYMDAKRLLRPDGRILVADWAPIETPKGPPGDIRPSAETLASFLIATGFTDVRVHPGLAWHSVLTATRPRMMA